MFAPVNLSSSYCIKLGFKRFILHMRVRMNQNYTKYTTSFLDFEYVYVRMIFQKTRIKASSLIQCCFFFS